MRPSFYIQKRGRSNGIKGKQAWRKVC